MNTLHCSIRKPGLAAVIIGGLGLFLGGCAGTYYEAGVSTGPARVTVAESDYVYYPDSEVYYSATDHVYVYRDHDHWVRRGEAPQAFVRGSASVHMDFRDSPEHHHEQVRKTYPRTWRPKPNDPEHRDHDDRH